MRNVRCSQPGCVGIIALFTLQGISMTVSSRAACYSTPRNAIDALVANSSYSPALKDEGYRVTRIESDQVLGLRWAMIARCGHPEWPLVALPANGASSLALPQETERSVTDGLSTAPVVRAGDIVRLWRRESSLRIEVAGVSEGSGGLGKTIRVRLLHRNTDDQFIPEQFLGVIRGPLDVEMQPR
jgi:hypothetical protein